MPDITQLRDLADELPPPPYADLLEVARRRRNRRDALATAAASAAVVLGVAVVGAALSDDTSALPPAEVPTATQDEPSPTVEAWTPERVRAEGTPGDELPATESGLSARQYRVCDGPRCEGDDGPSEGVRVVVEVTQAGRSALFESGAYTWFTPLDDDSVLVQDSAEQGPDPSVRYRLLHADGTEVELDRLDEPAPAVAGPGVVVVDDFEGWAIGMGGVADVYLVDERAGTLRPLDVPEEDVRHWGPNSQEFLWGVTSDCRVFWESEGTLDSRRLACHEVGDFTWMDEQWFPAGWLRPGRMALMEMYDEPGGAQDVMVLHVSLDGGASWQQVPVEGEPSPTPDSVPDILRGLG